MCFVISRETLTSLHGDPPQRTQSFPLHNQSQFIGGWLGGKRSAKVVTPHLYKLEAHTVDSYPACSLFTTTVE